MILVPILSGERSLTLLLGCTLVQRRTRGQKYQNTFAYKHNKSSKRTQEILAVPIGGVCRRCAELGYPTPVPSQERDLSHTDTLIVAYRCYDVLTWRKAYRKYKPKTRPGKCNLCAKKAVKQAYCSICRPCAKARGLCEKCGCKPAEVRVPECLP